ncbi:MAG: carboxypeptidase regulatory-like domain-containing protein [Sandaracinus sp.]|nr:carboxypeptidase regulatory-like domain-containing protein [Myxococcales bacterium]MCB9619937.1 carboxypeptidase regulatory-like domain-containing protein [Sandaracinus sp.]
MLSLSCLLAVGCGKDEKGPCTLGSNDGCDDGLVCEEVVGGENACFGPVTVEGRVFDTADDSGIGGATVVALDANGGARSTVVRSAADGTYSLPVPTRRDAEGAPVDDAVTLRVSASGYQTFPTAPRTALPLQLGDAVASDDGYVLMNATSDVGLISLATAGGTIEGVVDGPIELVGGVLVVAEQGGVAVSSAVTGSDGDFVLFNVPNGSTNVAGYRAGLVVTPESVDATGAVTGVVLGGSADGVANVSGSVNIVAGRFGRERDPRRRVDLRRRRGARRNSRGVAGRQRHGRVHLRRRAAGTLRGARGVRERRPRA